MRDPKRIDKFCEMLKAYWHMVPDWRFMQLVCNLQAQIGSDGFYLEDDKTMELIEQMLNTTDCYGWARLCQVIGNFFGGELSIGINRCSCLDCDNYDNGTYIIDGWDIVDRKYFDGNEQDSYDLYEMLCEIDENQPVKEQLGADKIKQMLDEAKGVKAK